MINIWKSIFRLFSKKDKYIFFYLLTSSTLLSIFDVAGFASVMPFIAVAVNPDLIESNSYVSYVYTFFGFSSPTSFLVFLGSFSFCLLLIVKVLFVLDSKYSLRFWYLREYELSVQLLRHYLGQKYEFFLTRSSAELSKVILTEVERAVNSVLMASIDLIASITGTAVLLLLLIFIDPYVALATLLFFGSTYYGIFFFLRRQIKELGRENVSYETEMYKRVREALDGVKDIKVSGHEKFFCDRFDRPKYKFTINATRYDLLSLTPEQILETVSFCGIILATLYFTIYSDDKGYALSMVALYAFAAYRILPYLKMIFEGVENMEYNTAAVKEVLNDFNFRFDQPSLHQNNDSKLKLKNFIELEQVSFRYPNSSNDVLNELTLRIPANSMNCVFGKSGAGKTTTIDIILGLLTPYSGELKVDGETITDTNIKEWQSKMGHVSHLMFLTDDTIAENIAIGQAKEDIDYQRVAEAAKLSCIHDFITEELPDGYDTKIGEKGNRLSAGQRQRICIARALFHNPEVIVLDEATNALDTTTENSVLELLDSLKENKTIIMITHKLSIAQRCDSIYLLNKGEIAGHGPYKDLINSNPLFQSMVSSSSYKKK